METQDQDGHVLNSYERSNSTKITNTSVICALAPRTLTVRSLDESISNSVPSQLRGKIRRRLRQFKHQKEHSNLLSTDDDPLAKKKRDLQQSIVGSCCSPKSVAVVGDEDTLSIPSLKVSFDNVEIREYPIELGDHPTITGGAPITLGWNHSHEEVFSINAYEEAREGNRRYNAEMRMPAYIRSQVLIRQGYTPSEIEKTANMSKIERLKRAETTQLMYRSKLHEQSERVSRGFRNFFFTKSRKQQEREHLEASLALGKKQLEVATKQAQLENKLYESLVKNESTRACSSGTTDLSWIRKVHPNQIIKANEGSTNSIDTHPFPIGSFIQVIHYGQKKQPTLAVDKQKCQHLVYEGMRIYLAKIIDRAPNDDRSKALVGQQQQQQNTSQKRWKYHLSYYQINHQEWLEDLSRIVSPPSVGNLKASMTINSAPPSCMNTARTRRNNTPSSTSRQNYNGGEQVISMHSPIGVLIVNKGAEAKNA